MYRVYLAVRKFVCALIALGLIAAGRVRRARKQALGGDVITAIYFHNPSKRLFTQCVAWLRKHGYRFISAGEVAEVLYCGKPVPKGAVWLSFDDGFRTLLGNVLPVVREQKVPVTLFIPSGIVEGNGLLPWLHGLPYEGTIPAQVVHTGALPAQNGFRDTLTVEELKQVAGYPEVTIGGHTVNHAITALCTEEAARHEIGGCKGVLESWTGTAVDSFAYPEGRFNGREKQFLNESGYKIAVTIENAFVTRGTEPFLVPRFSVADDISFPEAICNMVGVWQPVISSLKAIV